ncbi:hypothetical protein A3D55_00745 [Candidatus Jorgensenbacteria bacterium RIFCSPHIGHO2_02_FULL_45_20]|uniref:Ribosome-binding factor A n=1 Tax=Candidatus Jorgensenbacteria bacterium RIFCSPHIGHO2_02_FULL_45_20 TaxID=1798470 RepID=A0A1F6BNL5_9BACT|nr:MAG: hypothetical protein A3D55_00745 [Candidatus Jorgensenbacteria bacterium RIFCSPHIGHO2_02_FULL_45_20]
MIIGENMPKPFRNLKIASLIERELTILMVKEFCVPDALVTVTGVEVSEKLDQTKITISVIPHDKELEAFYALEDKRKELEYKVLRKSRLRIIPKFKFVIDSRV